MCTKQFFLNSFAFMVVMSIGLTLAQGQEGLVGYWKFDDMFGTTALDSAGGDHDGTLVGDQIEWVEAMRKGGLFFGGNNALRVEIPMAGMSASAGSVALWINANEPETSYRFLFGHTTIPAFANRLQLYMNDGNMELDLGMGSTHIFREKITIIEIDTWTHVALTWDVGTYVVYVDGTEAANGIYAGLSTINEFADIGNNGNPGTRDEAFNGVFDEIRMYDRALSADEILSAMQGNPSPSFPFASGPNPKDGATHFDTWVNFSWRPGELAVSHDIYIGDNFDNVNDGSEGTFVGNQTDTFFVAGFPGFPVPDGLVPGTTYYWRVDEVNEAEPNSPWKGSIWSFTIPPKTAYAPDPDDSAEAVSVDVKLSWTAGHGAKLHTVYFGETSEEVDNATGGQVQGTTTFTPSMLKMAKTYYWRVDEFDIVETHKGDVWSFTTEGAVMALNPVNGAVDVTQTPVLTWAPGFGASHEIYFGTDATSLELKGSGNLGSESYEPGQLEWNTTYYWRINEANSTNADSPWIGPLWSFTTANFLIVDDFESYNDLNPDEPGSNRIFYAWIDGLDDPTNGSVVGYDTPPFAEQTIVHSGKQSMPMSYDNSVGKSEATLTLTSNRDWTVNGVNKLTIWFRGSSSNAVEQMYVTLNGSARVDHDDPDAATTTRWTEWNIDLQAFADQGVNLANVSSITLGLSSVTGGTGMMYFDDIRLYPPAP